MQIVIVVMDALISIHALLAESDAPQPPQGESSKKFLSTLSLRRATQWMYHNTKFGIFLSTLSLRRATYLGAWKSCNVRHFYPRSPCGERQHAYQLVLWVLRFLSTLSLRRATFKPPVKAHRQKHFYPRSPCGERQL